MSVADDTTRNARGDDLGGSPVGIAAPLICTACSPANMPASVPVTATRALTNATLPHVHTLADLGVAEAAVADPGLKKGINVQGGAITCPAVAAAHREPRPAPASDLGAGMPAWA